MTIDSTRDSPTSAQSFFYEKVCSHKCPTTTTKRLINGIGSLTGMSVKPLWIPNEFYCDIVYQCHIDLMSPPIPALAILIKKRPWDGSY